MILTSILLLIAPGAGGVIPADQSQGQTVDFGRPLQTVDGFGFSTAWGNLPVGAANTEAFFSVTKGAGFSIVRNRIPFRENPTLDDKFLEKRNGAYVFTTVQDKQGSYKKFNLDWNNWDLAATKKLLSEVTANPDYQLSKVFSSPWTPPNNPIDRWKSPTPPEEKSKNRLTEASYATKPEVGGYLDPAHYQDYADLLADYVLGFKTHMGFPLYSLSLQNEPSFDCDYESCDWTPKQFHDFLLVLNKEFTRKGVWKLNPKLKIMATEDNNFKDSQLSEVYADPATRNLVQIAAGHQYEYGPWSMGGSLSNLFSERDNYQPNRFEASAALRKQVWMTEWNMSAFNGTSELNRALVVAKVMHQDFTQSNLNAFVFWWSSSLMQGNRPAKLLWAMAQYSRFVRPGWRVVNTQGTPQKGIYVTSFADPSMRKFAAVVVNTNPISTKVDLNFKGARGLSSVSVYRTSETENTKLVGATPGPVKNLSGSVPASSVTTYYGDIQR
jgi:glucuronoarabinoxylan endo-1,4-beta-xylanase